MTEGLGELLTPPPDAPGRFHGVATGIVTNTKDPDGLGRVKLTLPWLAENVETDWARVAVPMAGQGYGTYLVPDVDTEVLVAFVHGDLATPVVVGQLWSSARKPPEPNGDGKNDVRSIVSRRGHRIRLVDTPNAERVEIADRSGKNAVSFDTKTNTVTIEAGADVVVRAGGTLSLTGQKVQITSRTDLAVTAKTMSELSANGTVVIKGSAIKLN